MAITASIASLKTRLSSAAPVAGQPAWHLGGAMLETYARAVDANDATVRAYHALTEALNAQPPTPADAYRAADAAPGKSLAGESLIVGVGLGGALEFDEWVGPPGSGCLNLYTLEAISADVAINNAYGVFGLDALIASDVRVRVIHTGPIDAYVHRMRWRPLHAGISVARVGVTAGTLGCHVLRSDGQPLILSNNHVLANINDASIGDEILQPGQADGGRSPADTAALLDNFVPIDFAGINVVDCATALIAPEDASREFVYSTASGGAFYRVSPATIPAYAGLPVGKSGRTTGLTSGRVDAVGVSVRVNMPGKGAAQFNGQISIRGTRGNFSQPGDSGSLIWTWDQSHNPVGLLFAGGGGITFANPIDSVLSSLGVSLMV